jgi:hypothetical protein
VNQILGTSLSQAALFADCAKGRNVCQRPLSPDEQDYVLLEILAMSAQARQGKEADAGSAR